MKKHTFETIVKILLLIGVIFICVKMILVTKSCANNINTTDTIKHYPYWDLYEEGFTALDFSSIYFIDTTNMCVYYDNYDQFDFDAIKEITPDNINEDGTLILHISKDNLVELMNRILQWIQFKDDYDESIYVQSMFGIGESDDGKYYITFLGN